MLTVSWLSVSSIKSEEAEMETISYIYIYIYIYNIVSRITLFAVTFGVNHYTIVIVVVVLTNKRLRRGI